MAIPKMAAMHQPQEIRFAMAIPPNTMTKMMATGVSHARMLVCKDVAPVMKGDAAWANARSGEARASVKSRAATAALVL